MGRKSKLSEKQWAEIQRRLLNGEKTRALAKEFGIAESSLRGKIAAETAQIKVVANQIVATERAVSALPISAQITAHNLASRIRAITNNMAEAAALSSATAVRLTSLANSEAAKIDDADPMNSSALAAVNELTMVANNASKITLGLLTATKGQLAVAEDDEESAPKSQAFTYTVVDGRVSDADAH